MASPTLTPISSRTPLLGATKTEISSLSERGTGGADASPRRTAAGQQDPHALGNLHCFIESPTMVSVEAFCFLLQIESSYSRALTALCCASGCELGKSGLKQSDDGGVVEGLGEDKGSAAIGSNDARVCIRCKESAADPPPALISA